MLSKFLRGVPKVLALIDGGGMVSVDPLVGSSWPGMMSTSDISNARNFVVANVGGVGGACFGGEGGIPGGGCGDVGSCRSSRCCFSPPLSDGSNGAGGFDGGTAE